MLRDALADEDEATTSSGATNQTQQKKLHSALAPFNFDDDCFICGEKLVDSNSHIPNETRHAQSKDIRQTILDLCAGHCDEKKKAVFIRVNDCPDLNAVNGQYHLSCYALLKKDSKIHTRGRPVDTKSKTAFVELCKYIETSDECQFSMEELQSKLKEISGSDNDVYSANHLKTLISDHFKSNVKYTSTKKLRLFTFTDKISDTIYTEKWYADRKETKEERKDRIIRTAAEFIREDVRLEPYEMHEYPSFDEIEQGGSQLVPESLRIFTEILTKRKARSDESQEKLKRQQLFINQALISICRPRSFLSPIRLGLSLYLNRKFGSRHIIDILYNLGMSTRT